MSRYPAKDPAATVLVDRDFALQLGDSETLSNPSTSVRVLRGTDPDKDLILSGIPTIVGTAVVQKVTGGLAGVDYRIKFEVDTSDGEHLVEAVTLPVRTL